MSFRCIICSSVPVKYILRRRCFLQWSQWLSLYMLFLISGLLLIRMICNLCGFSLLEQRKMTIHNVYQLKARLHGTTRWCKAVASLQNKTLKPDTRNSENGLSRRTAACPNLFMKSWTSNSCCCINVANIVAHHNLHKTAVIGSPCP